MKAGLEKRSRSGAAGVDDHRCLHWPNALPTIPAFGFLPLSLPVLGGILVITVLYMIA